MDEMLLGCIEDLLNVVLDILTSKSQQLVASAPPGVRGVWWVQFKGMHALQTCCDPLAFFIPQETFDTMEHERASAFCRIYDPSVSCVIVASVQMRKPRSKESVDSWVVSRMIHYTAHTTVAASSGVQVLDVSNNPAFTMLRIGSSSSGRCAFCDMEGVPLKKCGRCHVTAYCNVECQRAHWKGHKANDCTHYKNLRSKSKKILRRSERPEC
jgi:hypothetical protein